MSRLMGWWPVVLVVQACALPFIPLDVERCTLRVECFEVECRSGSHVDNAHPLTCNSQRLAEDRSLAWDFESCAWHTIHRQSAAEEPWLAEFLSLLKVDGIMSLTSNPCSTPQLRRT